MQQATTQQTLLAGFWNGEPAQFRVVMGIVGDEPAEQKQQIEKHAPGRKRYLWFTPFIGETRQMIEVTQNGFTFYMDNEDGSGLLKVTEGKGCPPYGHYSVYPSLVVREVPKEHWTEYNKDLHEAVEESIDKSWMEIDPIGWTECKGKIAALKALINGRKISSGK